MRQIALPLDWPGASDAFLVTPSNARAAHLLALAAPVDDAPMAGAELHLLGAVVHDLNGVGEEVPALSRRGFLLDEARIDGHADSARLGLVHRP